MAHVPHIPSRVLPASGAYYTAATATTLTGSWREDRGGGSFITVIVTYTRGASGGYPKIRPVWTHPAQASGGTTRSGRDTTNDGTGTVSGAVITVKNYQTVVELVSLTDANPDTVDVLLEVPPDATALKIECAEVGNTGTPGTIVIDLDGEV